MKGHEYIREAVRTYLEAAVPAYLAAHLTEIGMTEPDPTALRFVLADGLQDINDFPVVVVRSTDARDDQRTGDGVWLVAYEVEIIAAVDHRMHGDYEGASVQRDRLLLAVREAVYAASGLTNDIDISPAKRVEQTGAAVETRAGVPLAAGTVAFTARVLESLTVLSPLDDVDAVDVSADVLDASQPL